MSSGLVCVERERGWEWEVERGGGGGKRAQSQSSTNTKELYRSSSAAHSKSLLHEWIETFLFLCHLLCSGMQRFILYAPGTCSGDCEGRGGWRGRVMGVEGSYHVAAIHLS